MSFNRDEYFNWLYDKAFSDDSYIELMDILFNVKFTWSVMFDKNRAADGVSLRRSYLFDKGRSKESYDWDDSECSFFEMFVGLSSKMAMLLDKDIRETTQHLIRNTEFDGMTTGNFLPFDALVVADFIMDREYDGSGNGGFFPMDNPPQDQRYVELLYQMNQYIIEYGW